ncbi:hypothetical protein K439DRAFT_1543271 [Ramaria rubella]|nr:hypothetical protein K439DRAFT_1543271 [Ramaria rubella]
MFICVVVWAVMPWRGAGVMVMVCIAMQGGCDCGWGGDLHSGYLVHAYSCMLGVEYVCCSGGSSHLAAKAGTSGLVVSFVWHHNGGWVVQQRRRKGGIVVEQEMRWQHGGGSGVATARRPMFRAPPSRTPRLQAVVRVHIIGPCLSTTIPHTFGTPFSTHGMWGWWLRMRANVYAGAHVAVAAAGHRARAMWRLQHCMHANVDELGSKVVGAHANGCSGGMCGGGGDGTSQRGGMYVGICDDGGACMPPQLRMGWSLGTKEGQQQAEKALSNGARYHAPFHET